MSRPQGHLEAEGGVTGMTPERYLGGCKVTNAVKTNIHIRLSNSCNSWSQLVYLPGKRSLDFSSLVNKQFELEVNGNILLILKQSTHALPLIFDRPGVAGAVLQSASSFIDLLIE